METGQRERGSLGLLREKEGLGVRPLKNHMEKNKENK